MRFQYINPTTLFISPFFSPQLSSPYTREGPKETLRLSSGGQASCSTGFPHYVSVSRNPPVSVYWLELLWEAVFSFSECILKTLSTHLPVSLPAHLPTPCWVFSSFDQKRHDSWAPPSLLTQSHPSDAFVCLFPWMKKALKRKHFDALKGIKVDKFKNYFEQWEKYLNRYIASNGEYFEVTEV